MQNHIPPPKWPLKFLRFFAKEEYIEEIEGDMEEVFQDNLEKYSIRKAKQSYAWDVLRLLRPRIIKNWKVSFGINYSIMIKNHLKIAFRSFWKQKLASTVNLTGLSIGIACASLGFIFIQHELSFDQFHDEPDQIYWLSASIQNKVNIASTPAPLAPGLQESFPEVSECFRLEDHEMLVQSGNEFFKERGHFVDPNFFSFFSFKLLEGNTNQVFANTNSIVLSEETARKYFGRISPIGKNLTINYLGKDEIFEVTGVAADAPRNSSLQYSFLAPIQFLYRDNPETLQSDWGAFPVTSFIRIKDKNNIVDLKEKLPEFTADKIEIDGLDDDKLVFNLRAFADYHLRDQYPANGLIEAADMSYIRTLGIIAGLILLVACLNFMNLANAQGSGRLLEVGVRTILGATRKQLIAQFLTEAVLISFLSLGLGIILIESILPFAANVTGAPLEIDWLSSSIIFPLIGIAVLAGIFAGLYPSIVLSCLNTVQTFKSNFKTGGNNLLTKGSLVFQFAVSIGLLSCTFIMYQQQQFIKNRKLGFQKEEIIVIPTQISHTESTRSQRLVEQYKNEILAHPEIVRASGVSHSFSKGNKALFIKEEANSQTPVFIYDVDPDYIPLLDIELLEGRNFAADRSPKQDKTLIVNEAFLRHFGIENAIDGYQLPEKFEELSNAEIIGVVKDYHYLNLKNKIRPLMLQMKKDAHFGDILVKIRPKDVDKTIARLRADWQKINPSKPFEFSFLDEDIQRQYLAEERWNKAITGAAVLAILIACMGLFGLIALILTERTKEIGVRKILGASIPDIAGLISRQFIILLGVAALIAVPISWWAMQKWLQNFIYKIDIQFLVFLAALSLTLFIVLLTSGLQAARAAMRNPVDALRHE